MSYQVTTTDTTTYSAELNSSGNGTYTVNMALAGGDVDITYINGYKDEYDTFRVRPYVNIDYSSQYSTNPWRRYTGRDTENNYTYFETIFNEIGCLYAGRQLTSQGIKTRMGFLNTEVAGTGMFDWQLVPVKVELINPAYYTNSTANAASGITVYTGNGSYVSGGSISFNISENTLKGYAGLVHTRSTTGNSLPSMFAENSMYVMFKMTCRYREHFDSRLSGDLLSRGYNPANNTKDYIMYADAVFNLKKARVVTTRQRIHNVNYSGDDSYNMYNSLGYSEQLTFDIYNDLLLSGNHYSYSKNLTYTKANKPTPGHSYYKISRFPYGLPTLGYSNVKNVDVSNVSTVGGYFVTPNSTSIDATQIAPRVNASYTYDKNTDKATWIYSVDATELSRYTELSYTIQVIGYETHQGVTTKVFDTGILANGHSTYSYTGNVTGLEAHDMSSTVQFNVYIMYHNVQLPISHAFSKTLSASNDILYFHGTTNGIGIGVPPKEHMLSTSILNITCNPEIVQTPTRHTNDITHKVGNYKIDDKLIDSPHWMLLGCGVYNVSGVSGTSAQQSYIEWYGLPHEACDGRCRFWVLQTYYNDHYPIPQAQKHRTDKPIITTDNGDLSTPDDAAVNVMDFMLYTYSSLKAFSGIRSYIWDDYINVHPKSGIAHYQIPIWDGSTGAWTYVDEDDLVVALA